MTYCLCSIKFAGKDYEEGKKYLVNICKHKPDIPDMNINNPLSVQSFSTYTPISSVPKSFINLLKLYCPYTNVSEIHEEFTKLHTLDCSNCPNIKSLPNTLVNLTKLNISGTKIKEVPKEFVGLEYLTCNEGVRIPDTLVNLKELKMVHQNFIPVGEYIELPDTLVNLEKLTVGSVNKLPKNCTKLIWLTLNDYSEIKEVPDEYVNLIGLEIYSYNYIIELPKTLSKLETFKAQRGPIRTIEDYRRYASS